MQGTCSCLLMCPCKSTVFTRYMYIEIHYEKSQIRIFLRSCVRISINTVDCGVLPALVNTCVWTLDVTMQVPNQKGVKGNTSLIVMVLALYM